MPPSIAELVRELTPTPQGSEAARDFYQARVSLFCGVMSDAQARGWWSRTEARRAQQDDVGHQTAVSPTLLAIDLERARAVAQR